jgi:hypothetical protein
MVITLQTLPLPCQLCCFSFLDFSYWQEMKKLCRSFFQKLTLSCSIHFYFTHWLSLLDKIPPSIRISFLQKAIDIRRSPKAYLELALHFFKGQLVEVDFQRAYQLFHQAHQGGSIEGTDWYVYLSLMDVKNRYNPNLVVWSLQNVEQGSGFAHSNLGYAYEHGLAGLPRNEQRAIWHFQMGSEAKNPQAQNNYGVCLQFGKGLNKDIAKAIHYFQLAAEQGFGLAMSNLAGLYRMEMEKKDDVVLSWIKKAASVHCPHALHSLGQAYEAGKTVNKDISTSKLYFQKATNAGYSFYQTSTVQM